jgi:hypothetical protein
VLDQSNKRAGIGRIRKVLSKNINQILHYKKYLEDREMVRVIKTVMYVHG